MKGDAAGALRFPTAVWGVWHREKLIAFEDEIETILARKTAEIVRRVNNG